MTLSIHPLTETLGAETASIELTHDLSAAEREALNRAFSQRSVLAIRGRKLDPHEMLRAVSIFGEIFEQHNKRFAPKECPQIHDLQTEDWHAQGRRHIPGEGYHTDHSYDRAPPKAMVLHAVKLPDAGGDTQFVDIQRLGAGFRVWPFLRAIHGGVAGAVICAMNVRLESRCLHEDVLPDSRRLVRSWCW